MRRSPRRSSRSDALAVLFALSCSPQVTTPDSAAGSGTGGGGAAASSTSASSSAEAGVGGTLSSSSSADGVGGSGGTTSSSSSGTGASGSTVIVSGEHEPNAIGIDGADLFFTATTAGATALRRSPKSGGAAATVSSALQGYPIDGGVAGPYFFWHRYSAPQAVESIPLAGGTIADLLPGETPCGGAAATPTDAYFLDQNCNLVRVPLGGGSPTVIAQNLGITVALAMTLDANAAYVAGYSVLRVPLDGSPATALWSATVTQYAVGVAVDAVNAYATIRDAAGPGQDRVLELPLDGSAPITLMSGRNNVFRVLSDGANVYVTENGDFGANPPTGALLRVPVGGGAPVALVHTIAGAGLVFDGNDVLVVDGGSSEGSLPDGQILRVAK